MALEIFKLNFIKKKNNRFQPLFFFVKICLFLPVDFNFENISYIFSIFGNFILRKILKNAIQTQK